MVILQQAGARKVGFQTDPLPKAPALKAPAPKAPTQP
jgi:hypothetical protein